jgi:dTDP-4-dehydrorhamnose reductase
MSIVVTGANGQVGYECVARGAVGLARGQLDLRDRAQVREALARLRPRAVINAAAYTAVDKAETDSEAAFAVNRDGVIGLAEACAELDIPLIHFSTDYVFDGSKSGVYTEDDPAAPVGVYARSKCEGEAALRKIWPKHLILRVSWVFGAHGTNFVKTILRLAMNLAARVVRNETMPWGTYNYCGTPVTTWHGFATEIVDTAHELGMIERKPPIAAIGTADYPLPAKRPANSMLDLSRLRSELGLEPQDWRAGLREVLLNWKNSGI